jgi:hypothetical protein
MGGPSKEGSVDRYVQSAHCRHVIWVRARKVPENEDNSKKSVMFCPYVADLSRNVRWRRDSRGQPLSDLNPALSRYVDIID